jgi:iron complex outermembrane receptor protein
MSKLLYLFPLSAAFLTAAHCYSQDQVILEEIVVTANKRESSILKTAAAISAFDSESRDRLGLDTAWDLVGRTPSLSITNFRVSLRGVGRPNLAIGSDPGIGFYWDGFYQTENGILDWSNLFDIERVEVLRGPQGTLYGRNNIGGAIKLVSTQPTGELKGQLALEAGNYGYEVAQGLISGPVTDQLSALVALSSMKRDGFTSNLENGEKYENLDKKYANLILKYDWNEQWTTTVKVHDYQNKYNQANAAAVRTPYDTEFIQTVNDTTTGEPLNLPGIYPGQAFANPHQGYQLENPGVYSDQKVRIDSGPHLNITSNALLMTNDISLDGYKIRYIAGWSDYDFQPTTDSDHSVAKYSGLDWSKIFFSGLPVSIFTGVTLTPSDQNLIIEQSAEFRSHDIQLQSDADGPVNWITGLYYYHSEENQYLTYLEHNQDLMNVYRFFGAVLNRPASTENHLYEGRAKVETTSWAAYGQMDWDLSEHTTLTLGLRYSTDKKEGRDRTFAQFVGEGDGYVDRKIDDDWSDITWRMGVDHALDDNNMVYGFIASGYRAGGFNFLKPTASTEVDKVKPESLISYEIGYKGSLLNSRLQVSTAAFYYDYSDLHVLKRDLISGIALNTFVNADDAKVYGLEAEVVALAGDHLLLSATWSYNQSEYGDFYTKDAIACSLGPLLVGNSADPLCSQEQNLNGNQFQLTPEHKLSANATLSWGMLNLDWSLTGSYMYTGEQFMEPFNREDYDAIDSWDRLDANLVMRPKHGQWQVTTWVKNIGDDRETVFRGRPSTVNHLTEVTLTPPRTYGVRFSYDF